MMAYIVRLRAPRLKTVLDTSTGCTTEQRQCEPYKKASSVWLRKGRSEGRVPEKPYIPARRVKLLRVVNLLEFRELLQRVASFEV